MTNREDEGPEELDHLLDSLLPQFDSNANMGSSNTAQQKHPEEPVAKPIVNNSGDNPTMDEAFVQDMMSGMEDLLRSMETSPEFRSQLESYLDEFTKTSATSGTAVEENDNSNRPAVATSLDGNSAAELTAELVSKAMQEMSIPSSTKQSVTTTNVSSAPKATQPKNYQETVKETMERLKSSDEKVESELLAGHGDELSEEALQQMMAQFLDIGGGSSSGGDSNDVVGFDAMLEGMMQQLMSKEILYEPISDLAKKYPDWLKRNRDGLSSEDYARYEQQYRHCLQIIRLFDDAKRGSDESSLLQVTELMQKMQDCGAPPPEILQQLAPGLDFGADGLPQLPDSADKCPVQ